MPRNKQQLKSVDKELETVWKTFLAKRDEESLKVLVSYYYTNLVRKIASHMAKKFKYKIAVDELASHGINGLYKTLQAFDPLVGTRFETYAYPRIWGSIIDGIREEDWVPRSVRIRQSTIAKAKAKIESQAQGYVADEEAIELAGFDTEEYYQNKQKFHALTFSSIENNINDIEGDDNKKDFNKSLISKNEVQPGSKSIRKEFLSKLVGKNFTSLERKVIYYYYYESLSMREMANRLDISESRISQIHQSILKRLKTKIEVNPNYFDESIIDIINDCNDKDSLI